MKTRVEATRTAGKGVCEVDLVDAGRVDEARSALPGETELRRASDSFKALAHPSRLKILIALEDRELCVCDVSRVLGLSMSGTSQQLRALRNLGAIDFRTEGKLAYYRLVDRSWLDLAKSVIGRFHARAVEGRR